MIKYRKFYDDDFNNITDPGKKYKIEYEMSDPDGSEYDIRPTKNPTDIQELINSYRDSCDIELLISRFTAGDVNAIRPLSAVPDADITNIPENIHELNDRVMAADNVWNSLPENIKANFSDIDDFYNSVGSDKFINAFTNVEKIEVPTEQVINAD